MCGEVKSSPRASLTTTSSANARRRGHSPRFAVTAVLTVMHERLLHADELKRAEELNCGVRSQRSKYASWVVCVVSSWEQTYSTPMLEQPGECAAG